MSTKKLLAIFAELWKILCDRHANRPATTTLLFGVYKYERYLKLTTIIDICAVTVSSIVQQCCSSQCKSLELPHTKTKSWVIINDLMSEQVILQPVCLISEPDIIACSCLIVHISLIRHNYTAPYVKQNSTWFYYFTLFEINLNLSHKSQVYSAKRTEWKKTRGKENGCMWDRGSRSRLWECVYCQHDFGSFSWSADVEGGCWLVHPAVHSCSWSVWDNVVSVSWSPLLQKERERVCGLGRHSQDVSGSAEADRYTRGHNGIEENEGPQTWWT